VSRTATVRVTSRTQRLVRSAEAGAAGEVFVDLRSRELVEPEALPSGAAEGRARAERHLNVCFEPQPARSELGQRSVEVGHSVQEYRRIAAQVIGEQQTESRRRE
jgi:hypothetical protein